MDVAGENILAGAALALQEDRVDVRAPDVLEDLEDLLQGRRLDHQIDGEVSLAGLSRRLRFELADGGTVVLDEVGELKLELQAKLLHVLEERKLRRVGGSREILVDVRVISLTNRNLTTMAQEGSFRQDLFYRLNIFPVTVPPLRERPEDILPLAHHFLAALRTKFGRHFEGMTREAENHLLAYSWPGNVRELRNVIERAMILERGPRLDMGSLVLDQMGAVRESEPGTATPDGIVPLEEMEREMVGRALQASGNNQTRAAKLLGITRDQLRYRLKKFDMSGE